MYRSPYEYVILASNKCVIGQIHGGVTGKILENHVRENIGWILFKTHNFLHFLKYTIATLKCKFGNYI